MSVPGQFRRDGVDPPPPPPPPPPILPDIVVESIEIGSLSSIAGQPAMLSNLAYGNSVSTLNTSQQNAVASQQALDELNVSVTAASVNKTNTTGPLAARSAVDVLTNNELAADIGSLKASTAAFNDGESESSNGPSNKGPLYVTLPATFVFQDADVNDVEMILPPGVIKTRSSETR